MKAIEFKGHNTVFAKDQPQYLRLPAHVDEDAVVTTCYKLSFTERLKILFTGLLWLQVMAFGNPLQPQRPTIDNPFKEKK